MSLFTDDILKDELEVVKARLREFCKCRLPEADKLLETISTSSGKLIRPVLVLLGGKGFGRMTEGHYDLAAVVEMIHIASLIQDDVLDEAQTRRFAPTANSLYGNKSAVLLGDILVVCAVKAAAGIQGLDGNSSEILDTILGICEGELLQQKNVDNLSLTEPQYLEIIRRKTALLMASALAYGVKLATDDKDLFDKAFDAGMAFGTAFQIMDDLKDLLSDEKASGKPVGADLRQGKLTLPVIHYLSTTNAQGREKLINLVQTSQTNIPKQQLLDLLNSTNSIKYSIVKARSYMKEFTDFAEVFSDVNSSELIMHLAKCLLKD